MSILGRPDLLQTKTELYKTYEIDCDAIPVHIAIIMDGNGRWAQKKNKPRVVGHKHGAESVRTVVKSCVEFGIHYVTIYAFSTENWQRPKVEISFLMQLFKQLIDKETPELHKQGVRVCILGDRKELPKSLQKKITDIEKKTQENTVFQLNICLNYGARQEILQGVKSCVEDVLSKKYESDDITEDFFSHYLYTKQIPDPEIVLRTSGEYRVSNFLLWQIAYSELIFTPVLWPDFDRNEFIKTLQEYQVRHRRFGGL